MARSLGDGRNIFEKKIKKKVGGRTVTETRLFVRVRYLDEFGRRRAKTRRVANRTDAKEKLLELVAEVRGRKENPRECAAKTFGYLATSYARESLVPAEYRDGRKVSGRRDLKGLHNQLRTFCSFFGAVELEGEPNEWEGGACLSAITYEQLAALRRHLLASPVHVTRENPRGRPRTITSVHRYLQTLRHMMRTAERRGWINASPFKAGPPLISPADEVKRKRILSFEEEDRLLAACVDRTETRPGKPPRNVRRAHLRAVVVCALDTGMRAGEIFKLRWRDVDAMREGAARRLTVRQENTKTLQERGAPVSRRLLDELEKLRHKRPCAPHDLVFSVRTSVKKSFAAACAEAGIEGLRFHDLRRTAATRLHRAGMPLAECSRILGHADITTTYRYIGVDESTTDRAADIFDLIEEQRRAKASSAG